MRAQLSRRRGIGGPGRNCDTVSRVLLTELFQEEDSYFHLCVCECGLALLSV